MVNARRILAIFLAAMIAVWPRSGLAQVSSIRDTEIEIIIRDYSEPIFAAAGVPSHEVSIYLLNDPSVNAFVTRGSDMYIHTGLLLEADRPLQVIGVIAHETGHITGGHVARMSDAFAAATTPMLITMGLGMIAMLAGSPDAGMALLSSGQHIAERTILKHSRVQESSADQAAVTFLTRAGLSGQGLVEMQEKFRHMEVLSARNQNPYVRTHPLSSDRIQALSRRVETSEYAEQTETPGQLFEFEMMQAKLHGFMSKPHYVFRRYPPSDTSLPARYARAIAHYKQTDIETAIRDIEALIEDTPNNPYFYELLGQVLFESGSAAESIPYHQKSVDMMPQAPLLRINLAQAMIATENKAYNQKAIDHLEFVVEEETVNSFAWFELAIAYDRDNRVGMADLATAERHFYNRQLGPAAQFAKRARDKLIKGTPNWQRATDIMQVAINELTDKDWRRRRN